MPRNFFGIVSYLSIACAFIGAANGQPIDCAGMLVEPSQLSDGDLYFRGVLLPGGNAWRKSEADSLNLDRPQYVNFIYVAKESGPNERPGMIVIKSGQTIVVDREQDRRTGEKIYLRRPDGREVDNDHCGVIEPYASYVAANSYDRFHDFSGRIDATDLGILTKFHVKYLGRDKVCKKSNETSPDAPFRNGGWRSNRGQFSFNADVVGTTFSSQMLASVGFPAYASTGFSGRKVEVRRYRMNQYNVACMGFGINVSGPNFFLRINDLERGEFNGFFARGRETSLQLSR